MKADALVVEDNVRTEGRGDVWGASGFRVWHKELDVHSFCAVATRLKATGVACQV